MPFHRCPSRQSEIPQMGGDVILATESGNCGEVSRFLLHFKSERLCDYYVE